MTDHDPNDGDKTIPGPNGGTLHPFVKGDPRTAELARRGAAARKAKKLAQRATTEDTAAYLATVAATYDLDNLGPAAAGVAQDIIGRLAAGEIPVRHGGEAAEILRALHEIARLEAGQATQHTATVTVSGDAAVSRLAELQQSARALLAQGAAMRQGELAAAAGEAAETAAAIPPAELGRLDGDGLAPG